LLLLLLLLLPRPAGDFMRDFSQKLVPLLEDKIRVMIYAGGHVCTTAHARVQRSAACSAEPAAVSGPCTERSAVCAGLRSQHFGDLKVFEQHISCHASSCRLRVLCR
jgi:hypothetical protein